MPKTETMPRGSELGQERSEPATGIEKSFFQDLRDRVDEIAATVRERLRSLGAPNHAEAEADALINEVVRDLEEIEHQPDAGSLLQEDTEGYSEAPGFSFSVLAKHGVEPTYMQGNVRRSIYTHPTESYTDKGAFLKKNAVDRATTILTVVGANWPAFYADLCPDRPRVIGVDQNLDQIRYLDTFITDDQQFAKILVRERAPFVHMKPLPYDPVLTKTPKRRGTLQQPFIDRKDPRNQEFYRVRTLTAQMAREGRLSALNCNLEDLAEDANLEGVEYFDLSNVPETVGPEAIQKVIDRVPSGAKIYMGFVAKEMEPFLEQLRGVRVLDQQNETKNARMVLVEKIEM